MCHACLHAFLHAFIQVPEHHSRSKLVGKEKIGFKGFVGKPS